VRDVRGISRSVATLPGVHVMRAGPDLGFDRILASEMETPILGISHAVNLVYIKRMIGSTKRCVPGQLQTSVAPLATVTSAVGQKFTWTCTHQPTGPWTRPWGQPHSGKSHRYYSLCPLSLWVMACQ
jgi:hypothetical protein